jgi:hypothetical protein
MAVELMDGKCGYDKYIYALELHHLDPKQKIFLYLQRV